MASIEQRTFKTRSGIAFEIRTGLPDDAAAILDYIKPLAAGTEFFVIEPDEFPATVDAERAWIQTHLDDPGQLLLLAIADGSIIGSITFETGSFRRISHRGNLGIAVAESWRGQGVGAALLRSLLDWAQENPTIEKVCLDVFAHNEVAINLYRKLGFVEEGRRVMDIRRGDDDYVDTVMMSRFVNRP